MGREQQEIGRESSLKGAGRGEAQEALSRRVELRLVEDARESLGSEKLLEEVVEKGSIYRAMYRVLTLSRAVASSEAAAQQSRSYLA